MGVAEGNRSPLSIGFGAPSNAGREGFDSKVVKDHAREICFGSLADIRARIRDVRFTP